MPSPSFNIGLVGYGRWGRVLNRYFTPETGFEIKTVVVKDLSKPRPGLPPQTRITASLEDALSDPVISAVVVAVPWPTHPGIARRVLAAGKDLFIEKPMATTAADALAITTLAEKKRLKVLVDYTFTFSRSVWQTQTLVADGGIGEMSSFFLAMHQPKQPAKTALYPELASHLLSILGLFAPLNDFEFTRYDLVGPNNGPRAGILGFSRPLAGKIVVTEGFFPKARVWSARGSEGRLIYNSGREPSLVLEKGGRLVQEYNYPEKNNLSFAVAKFYAMLCGEKWTNLGLASSIAKILERLAQD